MRFVLIISFLFLGCKASYILVNPAQQLPTPKTSYTITSNTNIDIGEIINEYVASSFEQNTSKKTIQINSKNKFNCCGCELCSDPSKKKLYGNIVVTKTIHCDSPKYIYEFIGYKFDDVVKVLRLLLIDGDYYKWNENSFDIIDFDEDVYSGFVEISNEGDRTLVLIGFDGCQI
jgi:hypothetical protein